MKKSYAKRTDIGYVINEINRTSDVYAKNVTSDNPNKKLKL